MAQPGTELAEVTAPLGVVVPPEQPGPLAEAIRALAANPDLQEELGRRGRIYAEKHWAKEPVLEAFLRALQSL